ncbi:MAG: TetR/AcrR family transcriptional regulator [Gemmatimonadota bacterium]
MSIQPEQILACARDLYVEEGLDALSMRRMAERLGVTAPALYRHYENKERVLVDLVGEAYGVLLGHLSRALEGDSPWERFRKAGEGYLEFAVEEPRLYQVLYAAPEIIGVGELPEETAARACAIGQFWDDRVRECMDAGFLERGDPTEVSTTLWAHAHGLVSIWLRGMVDLDEEAFRSLFRSSARRVLAGLATADHRRRLRDPSEETERPSESYDRVEGKPVERA